MFKEFKEFALRGNVLDMAIGVIIGGAFGKVVSSLVDDILMPPLGMLLGKINLSNLFINLSSNHHTTLEEAKSAGDVTLNYGIFINRLVDFFIISFTIYIVIKQVNRFRNTTDHNLAHLTTKQCPYCSFSIPKTASRCPHCTSYVKHP